MRTTPNQLRPFARHFVGKMVILKAHLLITIRTAQEYICQLSTGFFRANHSTFISNTFNFLHCSIYRNNCKFFWGWEVPGGPGVTFDSCRGFLSLREEILLSSCVWFVFLFGGKQCWWYTAWSFWSTYGTFLAILLKKKQCLVQLFLTWYL